MLLVATGVFAAVPVVERFTLSPREPGKFHRFPRAALNTRSKQTLVVFEKHPGNHPAHSTWARLLSPVGKPLGPVFPIVAGPNSYAPFVTYNPQRNEFLMVYANELASAQPFQLFAQRLNFRGRPTGPAIRISAESDISTDVNNESPDVLWNPRTGNYTILWQRYRFSISTSTVAEGLYGTILDPMLKTVRNATLIQLSPRTGNFLRQAIVRDAAFHPVTGRLMVAYVQAAPDYLTSQRSFYYLADLDPSFVGIQAVSFIKVKPASIKSANDIQLAFQPEGNGFVVYGDAANVRLRRIDPAGKLKGSAIAAFRAPLSNVRLSALTLESANGARGLKHVLLGIRDPFNTLGQRGLWAQIIAADGVPSGSPVLVDTLQDYAANTILSVLSGPPNSTNYRFVAVYEQGLEETNAGLTNAGLDLILLRLNFPL